MALLNEILADRIRFFVIIITILLDYVASVLIRSEIFCSIILLDTSCYAARIKESFFDPSIVAVQRAGKELYVMVNGILRKL